MWTAVVGTLAVAAALAGAARPSAAANTLTVRVVGSGTVATFDHRISCPTTCSASYAEPGDILLRATPAAGWTFAGWSGDCSGTLPPCIVRLDASRSATAVFARGGSPPPPAGGPGTAGQARYTVEFKGSGSWTRVASSPSLCGPVRSTESSTFTWDAVWKNVTLSASRDAGTPASGFLRGSERQTYAGFADQASCQPAQQSCGGPFGATENAASDQPPTLAVVRRGQDWAILPTVLNSPSPQGWTPCGSAAINESSEAYMAIGTLDRAKLQPLAAVQARFAARLLAAGSHAAPVASTPLNYPGGSSVPCVATIPSGFACTHGETWRGTVTVTRSR